MREILFKAKRVDNGEWIMGSLLVFKNDNNISKCIIYPICFNFSRAAYPTRNLEIGFWNEVESETVCQYTGFMDNNSNMIFEGDLLERYFRYSGKNETGFVILKDGSYFADFGNNHLILLSQLSDHHILKKVGSVYDSVTKE